MATEHTRYSTMMLSELEREAYRTNNQLALAIIDKMAGRVDHIIQDELRSRKALTKYASDDNDVTGVPV